MGNKTLVGCLGVAGGLFLITTCYLIYKFFAAINEPIARITVLPVTLVFELYGAVLVLVGLSSLFKK